MVLEMEIKLRVEIQQSLSDGLVRWRKIVAPYRHARFPFLPPRKADSRFVVCAASYSLS
jgi:hypothetical protein